MSEKGAPGGERDASMNAHFQVLRSHVERELRGPAVVMVTSAEVGDGKSLTAFSLAQCFARAGRRSALIGAAGTGGITTCSLQNMAAPSEGADEPFSRISLPKPGVAMQSEAAAELLRAVRSSYEFTIVDFGPLLSDDLALSLMGSVDGVLLSVRVGRAPTEQDELTVRIIKQSKGRIVGVVAVEAAAIAEFAKRHPAERFAENGGRRSVAANALPAIAPLAASVRS